MHGRIGRIKWPNIMHRDYWTATLPPNILVYHLLATGFITGILDATTYADFGTFTSNQTGNTVLLGIGAVNLLPVRMLDVGTSLASFLLTCLVCGQLAASCSSARARWWTLCSSLWQALTVLLVPCLAYTRQVPIDVQWSWIIILFLASSAGAQVAMAKQFGIKEIPTAMLTSPFADLLTDAHLFSLTLTRPYNVSRNRRVGYIVLLIAGVFIGAVLHKYKGTAPVLLLAGLLKVLVMLSFFFVPREQHDNSNDKLPCKENMDVDNNNF